MAGEGSGAGTGEGLEEGAGEGSGAGTGEGLGEGAGYMMVQLILGLSDMCSSEVDISYSLVQY